MPADLPRHCDVAIVGGGPAGLAAATELKRLGAGSIVVLEREEVAGGIPRHCGHPPFGMREFGRILRGPDYAARLAARATDAGVVVVSKITVAALGEGPRLTLATPEGARTLEARRVLLATGARETSRAARLIGGTKPGGVLSTGALQGLVYLQRIRPFRRPVILGTELVSFSALLTCRHLGIAPRAMIEPRARITARRPADLLPRLLGTRLLLETELSAICGTERVEAVALERASGEVETLETDGVIVSGRFLPEASLLASSHLQADRDSGGPAVDQFGRCSDPFYFAAGNMLRAVETAGWSWREGRAAGRAIAASLEGDLPAPERAARTKISVAGPLLKYVVPQRVEGAGRRGVFQLRVTGAARGTLVLRLDGAPIWSRSLSALPERRITVPLSVLPADAVGQAEFSVEESGG